MGLRCHPSPQLRGFQRGARHSRHTVQHTSAPCKRALAQLPPPYVPLPGKEAKPHAAAGDTRDKRLWQRRSLTPQPVPRAGALPQLSPPCRGAEAGTALARCWGHRAEALGDLKQESLLSQSRHSSRARARQSRAGSRAAGGDPEGTDTLPVPSQPPGAVPASHSEVSSADGQSLTFPWPGLPSQVLETKLPSSTVTVPTSDDRLHTQC